MRWSWLQLASGTAVFLASLTVVDFGSVPEAGGASVLAVALFAVPSIVAFLRWAGWRRGTVVLAAVGAAATAVEGISVLTGFPYGRFSYSDALGPLISGVVPFALPLSYLPLLVCALSLARRFGGGDRLRTVILSAALLVAFDLVIDPGAVAAGLWVWEEPGIYYGIPLTNYFGWAITGLAYSAAALVLAGKGIGSRTVPRGISAGALLTLSFWTGYLLKTRYLLPVVSGAALIALLCAVEWRKEGKRRGEEGRWNFLQANLSESVLFDRTP
ncbi:MAG: carotenoid biosynthesis protein [Candidatus Methanosuratincola sp.]